MTPGGPPPQIHVIQQAAPPRNALALVSLVAGLLSFCSILCCCIPVLNWGAFLAMLVFGLTALVTGVIGLGQARATGIGRTEAITGIALGSFWLLAAILGGVLFFMGCASLGALGAAAGASEDGSGGVVGPSLPATPPVLAPPSSGEAPDREPGAPPELLASHGAATSELPEPAEPWLDAPCTPAGITASRWLDTGQRGEDYRPQQAFDGTDDTAWAVRDAVSGSDWIEASFAPGTRVSRVVLTTGYEKHTRRGLDLFTANAHLARFTIETDAGHRSRDVAQEERSAEVALHVETGRVRLVVDQTWPGAEWQDLSISEITIYCGR
jgi:hypothetical protein